MATSVDDLLRITRERAGVLTLVKNLEASNASDEIGGIPYSLSLKVHVDKSSAPSPFVTDYPVTEILVDKSTQVTTENEMVYRVVAYPDSEGIQVTLFHPPSEKSFFSVIVDATDVTKLVEPRLKVLVEQKTINEHLIGDNVTLQTLNGCVTDLENFFLRVGRQSQLLLEADSRPLSDIYTPEALSDMRRALVEQIGEMLKLVESGKKDGTLKGFTEGLEFAREYLESLGTFCGTRPFGVIAQSGTLIGRQLGKVLDCLYEVVQLPQEERNSAVIQQRSYVWNFELRRDYLLGQFSAFSDALAERAVLGANKEEILTLLSSPILKEGPLVEFSRRGMPYFHEASDILGNCANYLEHIIIDRTQAGEGVITDPEIVKAVQGYAALINEYQKWWRMHSRFDLPPTHDGIDITHLDAAYGRDIIENTRLGPFKTLSIDEYNNRLEYMTAGVRKRNEQYGFISPVSISVFSADGIPPSEELYRQLDALERDNLKTPENPVGLIHPTGIDKMKELVEKHGALIITSLTGEAKGLCIVLPEFGKMPEEYQNRINDARQEGLIPADVDAIYIEDIVVNKPLRQLLKGEKRVGNAEFFAKLARHIAGRVYYGKSENDELIGRVGSPVWMVAMYGESEVGRLWASSNWTIAKGKGSIVEHGSAYTKMAKQII